MSTADSLAAWGVLRAPEVVELAAAAGLDLACAATMLERESSGGRNVWGSDRVDPGGTYVKGAPVTQADYLAYRGKRKAGLIKTQGVGPTQLTYYTLQDQADALDGCWDWRSNVRVGFAHLRQLQARYGIEAGFRAYNGGDQAATAGVIPAADTYGREAMGQLAAWRDRLGSASTPDQTEDDIVTPEDIAAIAKAAADELLGRQLVDLYPDTPVRTMTVGDTLAWAAANAGRAVFQASRGADGVAALHDDVDGFKADVSARLDDVHAAASSSAAPVVAGTYRLVPNDAPALAPRPEPVQPAVAPPPLFAPAEQVSVGTGTGLPAADPVSLFDPPQ